MERDKELFLHVVRKSYQFQRRKGNMRGSYYVNNKRQPFSLPSKKTDFVERVILHC